MLSVPKQRCEVFVPFATISGRRQTNRKNTLGTLVGTLRKTRKQTNSSSSICILLRHEHIPRLARNVYVSVYIQCSSIYIYIILYIYINSMIHKCICIYTNMRMHIHMLPLFFFLPIFCHPTRYESHLKTGHGCIS